MRTQGLVAGWILTAVVVVAGLLWLLGQWSTLGRLGAAAKSDHARLTAEVAAHERAIQGELVAHAEFLKDVRWNPARGTAAEVVRRLAALAQGGLVKVLGISALETESTPRFRKSWHRLEVTAPFRDLVDFAGRVEREGGILEEVVLEPVRADDKTAAGEVRSQFRLTAVEASDQGRAIMDRAVAAARTSGTPVAAALTLPVQPPPTSLAAGLRDPFRPADRPRPPVAVAAVRAPARGATVAAAPPAVPPPASPSSPPDSAPSVAASTTPPPPPPPPRPVIPVAVKGIVKFPGGSLAIVNDQIVGVGDVVDGLRVQEISDGKVMLQDSAGEPRLAALPGFAAGPRSPR